VLEEVRVGGEGREGCISDSLLERREEQRRRWKGFDRLRDIPPIRSF
jgi:hypothetical protein